MNLSKSLYFTLLFDIRIADESISSRGMVNLQQPATAIRNIMEQQQAAAATSISNNHQQSTASSIQAATSSSQQQ